MAYDENMRRALAELKQATGLDLELRDSGPADMDAAAEQIRHLTSAYREKYSKIHFLQSLLTGKIPAYDVQERAKRLHIAPAVSRVLYLMEADGPLDDILLEVLKGMFPSRSDTYLIPVSGNLEAILCSVKHTAGITVADSCTAAARSIVDTLNAEAYTRVRVSFSHPMTSLLDLASAFRETSLALKVGRLFLSEQTVFPYNRLGVGRLIYRLPRDLCEDFLREIFGEKPPDGLDPETTVTAAHFFQNNLNIAETARQLHIHRNTLIYRLEQIQNRTGLDLRSFEDAATFKIATMVINYLCTERRNNTHE